MRPGRRVGRIRILAQWALPVLKAGRGEPITNGSHFPPDALRSDRRDQSIKVFEVEDVALDVNCARPFLGAPDPKITITYDVKPAMAAVRQ
jgi:hypothetical protein